MKRRGRNERVREQGSVNEGEKRMDSDRKVRSRAGIEGWLVLNTSTFHFGKESLPGSRGRNNQKETMSVIYLPLLPFHH